MTAAAAFDPGLHVMVVVDPLSASRVDWPRVRREAGERGAIVSLLGVSGTDARWLVPAGPASAASPIPPTMTGGAATSGSGAAVIDKLFEAQALVPTIQRTEVRLYPGGGVESELADALHTEATIRVLAFDGGALRAARSPALAAKSAHKTPTQTPTRAARPGTPARAARPGTPARPARPAAPTPTAGGRSTAAPTTGPAPRQAPTTRRAPTTRDRVFAWSAAAIVAVIALVIAVPLTVAVVAEQQPVGTLADGSAWGPTLGAEVQRAEDINTGGTGLEQRLAVDPSTRIAYVSGWDGIRAVDAENLEEWSLTSVQLDNGTASLALSPDATRAYLTGGTGGDSPGELIAFTVEGDLLTETYRVPLPGVGNMGEDAAVSPDGARLYVADANTGFWALSSAEGSVLANPLGGMASEIAVNPVEGTVVVGAPLEDAILILDPTGSTVLGRLSDGGGLPDAVAYSPDGSILAVAAQHQLTFYGPDVTPLETMDIAADVAGLAFSPSSAEIAVLTSGSVRVIEVASMTELTRIPLSDSYILGDIAFSGVPGELLAVSDAVVRIDLSASRTNWLGYGVAIGLLTLVVLAGVIGAVRVTRRPSPRTGRANG